MSLLMKALEKAAKDRGETRKEPAAAETAAATAPAAPAPRSELSLEPLRPEASPAPAAPRADTPHAAAPPPPRPVGAAAPQRETAQAQARASTVVQAQAASRPPSRGAGTYLRAHPLVVIGTLAALVAIGFGVYVYLQIFHPQLFIPRPPAGKPGLPPLTQAPAVPVPGTPAPLPSGPLLKEAAEPAPAGAAPAPSPEAARPKPPPAVPVPAEEASPRTAVAVSRSSPEPSINPLHTQAYAALQSGQADEARRLYGQMASAEPKNVDALLGLAAIAAQRGEVEEASRRYLQILELEPRHALAQSGLIALLGRADPLAAESRLKQLIAREPSAHLHFTLGNLHAEQSQWAAAQQAYFQAHHLEPANPDYAYNLAVALEHISQPKLALGFYRRAAQLAAARGRANFSLPQVQERIGKLAAQVE